jgi:hypothetical protein
MEQIALAQEIVQGQDFIFTYDENGSLVLEAASIDLPDENERVEGAEQCEVQMVTFVDTPQTS